MNLTVPAGETLSISEVPRPGRPAAGARRRSGLVIGVGAVLLGAVCVIGTGYALLATGIVDLDRIFRPSTTPATPTETAAPEIDTPAPTETMVEEDAGIAYGTAQNPVRYGFSLAFGTIEDANAIATRLQEASGLFVEAFLAASYGELVEAMCAGDVQVSPLPTFNYLSASERGCVELALVSVRFASPRYQAQLITRSGSSIGGWEDLGGRVLCIPDTNSSTGWIIPRVMIRAAGLDPDRDVTLVIAGGHSLTVQAVHNGDCDAGTTFLDARQTVEEDIPDVLNSVVIAAVSPEIPNDVIAFAPQLDAPAREALKAGLIDLVQDPANADLIDRVYGWQALEERSPTIFDGFRRALDAAGMTADDLGLSE